MTRLISPMHVLRMNYTPKTHQLFDQIVPVHGDGIRQVAQVASGAPEKNNNSHDAVTGNGIDGFRLVDLLFI